MQIPQPKKRKVEDHHVANLDKNAEVVQNALFENSWFLLTSPSRTLDELKAAFDEQMRLQGLLNWMGQVRTQARPPSIIPANGESGIIKSIN